MCIRDSGSEGQTYINPDEKLQAEYEQKRVAYLEEKAALAQFVGRETKTADGVKVELCANIGKPEDALKVVECDGEGIEMCIRDRYIQEHEEDLMEWKVLLKLALLCALPLFLVVIEPNLSTTLDITFILLSVIFVGGFSMALIKKW